VDDDGSIILGTQKDNENSVFRQPRIPQQCRSTSINKNNTSMNESNESQIAITLHGSDINISENQVSIHDVETQKFEEGYKMTSNSIYDMETQGDLIDIAEHIVEANVKTGKQLPKLNVHDKTAGKSMTDIHDIETQNCIDDINEMETQKINIQNVTGKKFTTDIHIVTETQKYTNDTDEGGNETEKSEIDKNNIQEKSSTRIGQDIHNLETQKLDNKYIAEDISDMETQLELDSIAKCEKRDISDMETQFVTDMTNETSNDRVNKDKDKNDIIDITKNGIDQKNAKLSKSRSSSPSSLNLSSPGIEDCPSPLNQSSHLLESSDLLEFFSEGIDKQEVQTSNMSTPKSLTKVSSDRNSNVENVQTMVNNEEDNEDIFEAPTQRISSNFEALMSDNSETDEENMLIMCKVPKKKHGKSQLEQTNNDSETDAEEYVAELAKKQCKSSKILNKPSNEDISDKNDPGTSIESEDMFDVQTQRLNNSTIKDTSNSSINQSQNTNKINGTEVDDVTSTQTINNVDQDNQTSASISNINDIAPTLLVLSHETSKTVINSKDFESKNQNDLDDMTNTHIINAKSVDCCTIENLDREDTDYELAPTQLISEIESKKKGNSTCERSASEVNLNDTLEQKLNEMFDDVNNDTNSIHESPHMSTQYLENILESSQCYASTNKSIADDRDTNNMPQKQVEKKNDAFCNQHNLLNIEINTNNVNKAKNDSQNSDVYFSTITTRRKRNILRDTQELADSTEDTTSRHDINFSQVSKADNEKDRLVNDNIAVEFNKKRKRISKTKNKSDEITEILNDNNKNKTLSSGNIERSLRSSKSMKQKDKTTSKTNKQVLKNPVKVDDAEENTSICTPCPSGNGQRAQTLDTLYESDDDILTRLPAVRISGTLSNPASPSASSTSTVRSLLQRKYKFLA